MGAAAAALAVLLSGVSVPSANALPIIAGTWTLESEFGPGDFGISYGVAVDPSNGDVYVTDAMEHTLSKYNRAGEMLLQRGGLGAAAGSFNGPHGIALDSSGNVYVADTGNNRIQKFNSGLGYLTQWGSLGNTAGKFNQPIDVAVRQATGQVFVADMLNNRIQKFDADGTPVAAWGSQGQGESQFDQPRGLAVSGGGVVLVADTGNDRIQALRGSDGVFLEEFGAPGTAPGQFDTPADLLIDQDRLYVADIGNHRVQVLDEAGAPVSAWTVPGTVQGLAFDSVAGRFYASDGGAQVLGYRRAAVPVFGASTPPKGVAGRAYSAAIPVGGFPAVAGLAVAAGQLPPGLKLLGTKIVGVPSKPGSYPVTLRADNGVLAIPLSSRSLTISVAKATAKVSAKFSTKYPREDRTRIKARITVSAAGTTGLSASGKVRVYYGKKRVKTYTVKVSQNGRITVRLPKFTKKGKTKVTLRYLGNTQLSSAKRTITVRVR